MFGRWSKSRWFLLASSLMLAGSCLFWALLSARLQNSNADQLIDGYLFDSWHIFTNASFPNAHSFLLKWPLFALSAAHNNSSAAVTLLTVCCALSPIAALVYLLWRIERRPVMLGLWFLALSSMLLLVPAQPSPGTLLPVNFAMFTTRNLEYAVFLLILALLTNVKTWRSKSAWTAGILAVVLMASDGIFMPLCIGALGLLAILRVKMVRQIMLWFGVVVAGYIGAAILIKLLDYYYVTGFVGQTVSPYGLSGGASSVAQAVVYGVVGIGTLLGANPAYAHLAIAGLPEALKHSVHGPAAIGYVVNAVVAVILIGLTIYFVATFRRRNDRASLLAMLTLGAALASAGIYVLTKHYYPADSRYLAIWFFALVLSGAVVLRSVTLSKKTVTIIAIMLLGSLPFALWGSWQQYTAGRDGLKPRQAFAELIADTVHQEQITAIVGDYWDVAPVRQATKNQVDIVPLVDCTKPATLLSSTAWQKRVSGKVAYVLNTQPYQSGFPTCSETVVADYFGSPDQKVTIHVAGQPDMQLLMYNNGMRHLLPAAKITRHATPPPLDLPSDCKTGRVLQVVAHEDDDLLFMNPDLQDSIDAQNCIMTIYITAGDAGSGEGYANGRVAGAEAAYTYLFNGSSKWSTTKRQLHGREVTVAKMESQPRLVLMFLNLPDGNMRGTGFRGSDHASLERLREGYMNSIKPIEGEGSYTDVDLVSTLSSIMQSYQPNEVRTQNYNPYMHDGDHSDHHAVGQLTEQAFRYYNANATLESYAGYPVRFLASNVEGVTLAAKEGAFFAYANHDAAACNSVLACYEHTAYGSYLPRQYSRIAAANTYVAPKILPHKQPLPQLIKPKPLPQRRSCELGGTPYVINCPLKPLTDLAY